MGAPKHLTRPPWGIKTPHSLVVTVTGRQMPNIKSAKKRMRQQVRRTEVNRARTSRVRTYIKKVETAIEAGDKAAAEGALKAAQPEIMRGVTKGVLHRNTASRRVSRLSARVKAMA